MPDAPLIVLPPSLLKRESPAGTHRLGLKALFYGPSKSGKSFALASFPHPIFAVVCGENGIEDYLHPELGDKAVTVDSASSYTEALEFGLNHPKVASVVIDGANLAFEDWMASWEDTLGVDEIKGQHWKKVKGPWKVIHRKAMLSPKHIGFSAWPKGAKYMEEVTEAKMPGADPIVKLRMVEQDAAHVERMIPFAVDVIFKTEIELDKKFAPTSIHRLTYMGGRRPKSIPANELYSGKYWRFDASKVNEQSPFEKVLKPIIDKWGEGAVTYVGLDANEAAKEVGEAQAMFENQTVGELTAAFNACNTFDGLVKTWNENKAAIDALPDDKRKIVVATKDAKKKEFGK